MIFGGFRQKDDFNFSRAKTKGVQIVTCMKNCDASLICCNFSKIHIFDEAKIIRSIWLAVFIFFTRLGKKKYPSEARPVKFLPGRRPVAKHFARFVVVLSEKRREAANILPVLKTKTNKH